MRLEARPRKFYLRKFVFEQNLAKPRNILSSKILGYMVIHESLHNIMFLSDSQSLEISHYAITHIAVSQTCMCTFYNKLNLVLC